ARLGLIPAGSAAQTNDLGEFRLFGLAPGEVYVHATSRSGFGHSASPRPTVPLATYFPGTADVVGAMPITLAAGQTSADITRRIVSAPEVQVSGVVSTATVNGVTTQYRDDAGTRVAVTVNDASLAGVGVVVRASAR